MTNDGVRRELRQAEDELVESVAALTRSVYVNRPGTTTVRWARVEALLEILDHGEWPAGMKDRVKARLNQIRAELGSDA